MVTLCLLLVAVLAPLSIVAIWAHDMSPTPTGTSRRSRPLAEDPAIQDVVIQRITTEIVTRLDVEAVTQEAIDALAARGLPSRAAASLTALTRADGRRRRELHRGPGAPAGDVARVRAAWVEANRQAHDQMVAVLTGETGNAVEVSGSTVSSTWPWSSTR